MIGAVSWNAGWFSPGTTTGPIVDYLPNRGLSSAAIWFRTDIAYLATSGMLMRKQLFEEIEGFLIHIMILLVTKIQTFL